uniref:Uncharacterized protein n=1 Tax=Heterorhabditis bacteriophora TaxID=37862 RepID=A0A1I7XJI7_HETBA
MYNPCFGNGCGQPYAARFFRSPFYDQRRFFSSPCSTPFCDNQFTSAGRRPCSGNSCNQQFGIPDPIITPGGWFYNMRQWLFIFISQWMLFSLYIVTNTITT